MAFVLAALTVIATLNPVVPAAAPSPNLMHYRTTDTRATVQAAGYFNDARDTLQVGDHIMAYCSDGLIELTFAAVPASGNISSVLMATARKQVSGQATTVAAVDTIATGLNTVSGVLVSMDDDPVDGAMQVSGSIGNQAGAPAAGSFYLKGWKSTDGDATLIAATTFGKKVNWTAWGT